METKRCISCKQDLSKNLFGKDRTSKDSLKSKCKKCLAVYRKKNYDQEREKIYNQRKQWKLKKLVMEHYSKGTMRCLCCGENHLEFLTIDHPNGNGRYERLVLAKGGTHFYRWLKNHNFPEGYRVLCSNCNTSKGFYGYCPHKRLIED